ncbi:RNA-associated protein [miscellaneous Crenarchaeota group-15 archaeon DG-45]|uniref:RNA-associated protein n=1 Tax=miscellaneous Crenarchaeota group-15 archaeon DG-45 TaxID=1685127 RepID=A0A0M0BL86_9ARCH|nr:MAG: RNA-associated protein [miscellaneous Crenarchaeota group-15 archaeon DG-45]
MSDRYTLVRYAHAGEKFEILVDPNKGLAYKRGELDDVSQALVLDTVFTDANKGERASVERLESAFGTSDPVRVAEIMFEKGTLQLTAHQRREMAEQKRKQVVSIISRSYVDPRTKLPHPQARIENALEEAHVSVDPLRDAEEQIKDVVRALAPVLPLSMETVEVAIKIPPEHASRAYGIVKSMGEIKREEWQQDGSWIAVVVVSAAMQVELFDRLGRATQGNLQSKILG